MERCVGAISPCVVMTLRPILALSPGAGQAPLVCVGWWALSSAGVKSRGPTKQVRAKLAFRERHFVASNTGRFILTFILQVDTITGCYCGVPTSGVRSQESGVGKRGAIGSAPFASPASKENKMLLMQRMGDSSLRLIVDCRFSIFDCRFAKCPPLWRLTNVLFKVRNRVLTQRDVKNEDRTGYVYENTGGDDKMAGEKTGFYTKMHAWREDQQESVGFLGRECISYTIRQDGRRQTVDGKRGETVGTRCRVSGAGASTWWLVARGYQTS